MFVFLVKNKVFSVYQPYQFVKNHITALMMGTQTVPKTVAFNESIQLIVRADFISVSRCESITLYTFKNIYFPHPDTGLIIRFGSMNIVGGNYPQSQHIHQDLNPGYIWRCDFCFEISSSKQTTLMLAALLYLAQFPSYSNRPQQNSNSGKFFEVLAFLKSLSGLKEKA